jgi:hypothetical protein
MTPFQHLSVFAAVVASVVIAPAVQASEAYLCENQRIVYVEFGALEEAKKSDPCIAAYYGRTVEAPVAGSAAKAPPLAITEVAPVVPDLRPLSDPEIAPPVQIEARAAVAPVGQAPFVAAGVVSRKVRVINAGTIRHAGGS